MGVPQLTQETPGVKEEELADLTAALRRAKEAYRLEGVCTGALASVYQKSRIERICGKLDLKCLAPLWGMNPERHLRRLVKDRFIVLVISVSALGLDQSWLGRVGRRAGLSWRTAFFFATTSTGRWPCTTK
jgi:diphthine-ammonia ligase